MIDRQNDRVNSVLKHSPVNQPISIRHFKIFMIYHSWLQRHKRQRKIYNLVYSESLWNIATGCIFIFIKINMHWIWFISSNDRIVSFEDVSNLAFLRLFFYMKSSLFDSTYHHLCKDIIGILLAEVGGLIFLLQFLYICISVYCIFY